jgi:hypothetical protein
MEIVPYLIGVVMFLLVLYWSAANATAEPGQPSFGLFRYPESAAGAAAAEKERKRQSRAFQPQAAAPADPDPAARPGIRPAVRPRPAGQTRAGQTPAPRLPRR